MGPREIVEQPQSRSAQGDGVIAALAADTSKPDFNRAFAMGRSSDSSVSLPELGLTDNLKGNFGDPGQIRRMLNDSGKAPTDASPVQFQRNGSSEEFHRQTQELIRDALSKLKPEAQESLAGLKVVTSKEAGRGLFSDTPGAYTGPDGKPPNTLALNEGPMARRKENLRDVINHEIGHPLDVKGGNFAQSPAFQKAFSDAVKALPPDLRKPIEQGIRRLGPEMARSEVLADLVAFNLGSPENKLSYLPANYLPAFKDASKLVRERFFK